METKKEIGRRVRSRREELELTQQELADRVGYKTKGAINKVEMGINGIPARYLQDFARALFVDVDYLLLMNDNAPSVPGDVLPPPRTRSVPILGTIACGTPIEAVENYDGEAAVPEDVRCDFALRCKGDSMTGARINDGDIVYIRQQPQVESGQIAAVLIEGEATLKRVYYHPDSVVLMPANPAYEPMVLNQSTMDASSVRILGLAVAFTSALA
jgi:repressor LexA